MEQDPRNRRWFPANSHTTPAMRDAETVYAVLGPTTSWRLVALHNAARDSGLAIDDDVSQLMAELESTVGTLPSMLPLMSVSAALSHYMMLSDELRSIRTRHPDSPHPWALLDRHLPDVAKLFGWQVVEMLSKFGFTEETFTEYVENEWRHYGDGEWPPATAAYTSRTPESVSRPLGADFPSDLLDVWTTLWERFGHPTLIGAHLPGTTTLDEYVEYLRLALLNASTDIKHSDSTSDPKKTEERLRDAVDQIARARDEIRRAQDVIVSVFPT